MWSPRSWTAVIWCWGSSAWNSTVRAVDAGASARESGNARRATQERHRGHEEQEGPHTDARPPSAIANTNHGLRVCWEGEFSRGSCRLAAPPGARPKALITGE